MIAGFPAVLSLAVCLLRSPAMAFVNVYLPVLLLIPDHFRWVVPGLPDPGFQHAAIVPIALLLPFMRRVAWRVSLTDLLVLLYAGFVGYSEYRASGWWDTQNLLLDVVCAVMLPYVLAKLLIQPEGLGPLFARRFTLMLAIVALLSLWEFRMGTRLFFETLWGGFFPDQAQLPVQYRWGFGRIGGPFTHAILAGMIFGVGLFLQAWLLHERQWRTRRSGLVVLGLVMLGALLCMSRGPWLGILLGFNVAILGFVKDRKGVALRLCLVALLVVPPVWHFLEDYSSVSSLRAASVEQQNVAYRAELLDAYMPKVWRQPEFGYGFHSWPRDHRYPSIDNHYLLLALRHGVVAVALLVALMVWVAARLWIFAFRLPPKSEGAGLAFTLIGAIASISVAIATAYLGAQVEPVFFLLIGWSDGLLVYGHAPRRAQAEPEQAPAPTHAFRRVLS